MQVPLPKALVGFSIVHTWHALLSSSFTFMAISRLFYFPLLSQCVFIMSFLMHFFNRSRTSRLELNFFNFKNVGFTLFNKLLNFSKKKALRQFVYFLNIFRNIVITKIDMSAIISKDRTSK